MHQSSDFAKRCERERLTNLQSKWLLATTYPIPRRSLLPIEYASDWSSVSCYHCLPASRTPRSQFAIRKWRFLELEWELTEQRFQLIRVLQQSSIPRLQRDILSKNPASVRMQWSWRIELSLTWWTRSDTLSKTTFAKMTFDTSYWESKSSSSCTSKRAGKLRSQLELRKGVTTMMILFSKSIPFLPSLFRDVESVDQRYCRV